MKQHKIKKSTGVCCNCGLSKEAIEYFSKDRSVGGDWANVPKRSMKADKTWLECSGNMTLVPKKKDCKCSELQDRFTKLKSEYDEKWGECEELRKALEEINKAQHSHIKPE